MIKRKRFYLLNMSFILIFVFQFSGCHPVDTAKSKETELKSAAACDVGEIALTADDDLNKKRNVIKTEFEKNCRLWREKNISNYDLSLEGWQPSSTPQVKGASVKVRDNKIKSIDASEPAPYKLMISIYEQFGTIDKMFDEIRAALKASTGMNVTFNQEFGYPEKLNIQYFMTDDHSYTVTVKKLEIVE